MNISIRTQDLVQLVKEIKKNAKQVQCEQIDELKNLLEIEQAKVGNLHDIIAKQEIEIKRLASKNFNLRREVNNSVRASELSDLKCKMAHASMNPISKSELRRYL